MEAATRPRGAGFGRSRPFDVPVAWSAGEVPVSFGSWPWPARERAAVYQEAGAVRADPWPLQAWGPGGEAGQGALTGAARSGCGRPGCGSSGHHQTEPLAGRDRGRAEGGGPRTTCLAIRFSIGCALIISRIIQTILLDPSGAVWTDEAANVSRPDPSGAVQSDAEHLARNRKVIGQSHFGTPHRPSWTCSRIASGRLRDPRRRPGFVVGAMEGRVVGRSSPRPPKR
jgi:hypothetical protein